MPDISMCENQKCPSRKSCYRYTAKPNEHWQTYADFEVEEGEDRCKYYTKTPACLGTERGNIEL